MTELQNKLLLSDHYKNRLKSDIHNITMPANVELRNTKMIVIDNCIYLTCILLIY